MPAEDFSPTGTFMLALLASACAQRDFVLIFETEASTLNHAVNDGFDVVAEPEELFQPCAAGDIGDGLRVDGCAVVETVAYCDLCHNYLLSFLPHHAFSVYGQ